MLLPHAGRGPKRAHPALQPAAVHQPHSCCLSVRLIRECPAIAGIKDSSGDLDTLRELTIAGDRSIRRIVGHDAVIAQALEDGCSNGIISGVAGVMPELSLALCFGDGFGEEVQAELLGELNILPVPWALKVIAETRGLFPASFPWPVSATRAEQIVRLRAWFEDWWRRQKVTSSEGTACVLRSGSSNR